MPRGGSGDEVDPMKELLEIVMWNDGESETDITGELTDEEEDDSDDEEMACIKRLMDREKTVRVARPKGTSGGAGNGNGGGEGKGTEAPSRLFSVSSLRFESQLKIGSTAESSNRKSIVRLERTNTMERAFKGMVDDNEMASSSRKGAELMMKTESSSTIVAGDEENFWDNVEF